MHDIGAISLWLLQPPCDDQSDDVHHGRRMQIAAASGEAQLASQTLFFSAVAAVVIPDNVLFPLLAVVFDQELRDLIPIW